MNNMLNTEPRAASRALGVGAGAATVWRLAHAAAWALAMLANAAHAQSLQSPGFERQNAAWSIWGGAARVADVHEGRWALRTVGRSGAEQRIAGLRPNTSYVVAGWGRTTDQEPLFIGVKDHGAAQKTVAFGSPAYGFNYLTFTTGAQSDAATVFAYKHSGAGFGYADDLVFVAEEGGGLVQNGSFEDGNHRWNTWGGAIRVQDQQAGTARWALRVNGRGGAEQQLTGLLANTRYRVSGWASTSDSQPMLIGVKDYGGTQKTAAFTGATLQFNTLTFTTGPNQTSATVFAYKPSGSGLADKISVQVADQGPADEGYRLVWSDEFDGNGPVDASKWGFEQGFVRNQELQWYQPDNAVRSNGVLVIEGRRENRPNPNYEPGSSDYRKSRPTIQYSSSSLTSRGKAEFQYGRIEVRAKVTNAAGTWPAIWTLGTQCQWPSNGEVDIMENYGGNVLANFAFGTDQPYAAKWQSVVKPVAGFDDAWKDRFHVWELDWNPDRMSIYLDGELVNAIDLNTTVNGAGDPACAGRNPFRQKHYLLLNLALGGSAGGTVADLNFPTQYLVDYVRVYQKSGQ